MAYFKAVLALPSQWVEGEGPARPLPGREHTPLAWLRTQDPATSDLS